MDTGIALVAAIVSERERAREEVLLTIKTRVEIVAVASAKNKILLLSELPQT
jgi:hypothetical protein